jgi:MbtH protein
LREKILVDNLRVNAGEIEMSWGDDQTEFIVVMNEEEQYSIWPSYKAIPAGWRDVGRRGNKADCLAYIETAWTDMRPRSLREAMARDASSTQG